MSWPGPRVRPKAGPRTSFTTRATHPARVDGSLCSAPDLSGFGRPQRLRVAAEARVVALEAARDHFKGYSEALKRDVDRAWTERDGLRARLETARNNGD